MRNFYVDILNSALDNINGIWQNVFDYTDSLEIASRVEERIFSAIRKLAVFPKVRRVRKKDAFNRELRYLPVASYIVVYTVYDDDAVVQVLNVIHNKRDIDSLI